MRFFSNPVVGLISTLASIVGVPLAVYFYVEGTKFRELVYYVNPAQAIVIKTGEASRLRVSIGERELKSDVTTAQIAVWNRGNESVKPGDVLAPLTIRTSPAVPILEATVRKKSRDVVDLTLDQKHLEEGAVGLSWNILEQGDGGVIQVVYAGGPDTTKITVNGVIEGEHQIRQLQYSGTIMPVAEQIRNQHRLGYVGWFMGVTGLFVFCFAIFLWREDGFRSSLLMLVPSLITLGTGIYLILQSRIPEPPFGF